MLPSRTGDYQDHEDGGALFAGYDVADPNYITTLPYYNIRSHF